MSLSRKWFETDSDKDVREIDVLEDPKQAKESDAARKQRELIEAQQKAQRAKQE